MALKASIFKVNLQIADMDRAYYNNLTLTLAQHPSETDERLMVRLLAFALHSAEGLKFTEGISAEDEPAIWKKNMTGEIELWLEVGLPDEKRIRKACNRARQVCIYAYGGRTVQTWWQPIADKLLRHNNLKVLALSQAATRALGELARGTLTLQCTIQEGQIWIGNSENTVFLEPDLLYGAHK